MLGNNPALLGKGTKHSPCCPNPPAWAPRVSLGSSRGAASDPAASRRLRLHPGRAGTGPAGPAVPRVPAQHWLQGAGPWPRRPSRDSVVPVGVGGVTMMEGTCRCFCPEDAVRVPSPPFPLLTHVFKPGEVWGEGKKGD